MVPQKRHKAIVSFSKEHHLGLLLVWKIRKGLTQGISPDRISNYLQYFFKEDLTGHFRDEEKLLFTVLPEEDPLRKRAEASHRELNGMVSNNRMDPFDTALLLSFAQELERHIRFEERTLFPHIQNQVGERELKFLESRMPHQSDGVENAWKDAFWETERS